MTQALDAPVRVTQVGYQPSRSTSAPPARWLVESGGNRSGLPLVMFPHAGAGPSAYLRLARALGGCIRPLIVHLPGRESRIDEPPCGDMPTLLRCLCRAVLPLVSGRFVFYGHSMGALLAFELARHLRRLYGIEPDRLVVSGRVAPRVAETRQRHQLSDGQLWESVCGLLGTPREVADDPAMRTLLLPVLRADLQVCDTYRYRPEPVLGCPITSFAGDRDDEASPADMAPWAQETAAGHHHQTLPGNHFFHLAPDAQFPARLARAVT